MIKNKKNVSIYEGPTGILELTWDDGLSESIPPITNLDSAIELLHTFYFIKTLKGDHIKDAFKEGSIDWFPACISLLYWQYFYTYVKYSPLIDEWFRGNVKITWENKGALFNFIQILEGIELKKPSKNILPKRIGALVVEVRNNLVCKTQADLIFHRFSINDFRTNEILEELKAVNSSVVQLIPFNKKTFFQKFFDSEIMFTTGATKVPYLFGDVLIANHHSGVMIGALSYVKRIVHGHRGRYKNVKKLFSRKRFRGYLGIDDANWVYPYIYAAKYYDIPTFGIQHGVYTKRHLAYLMPHIDRYVWYDKILVWGTYWREKILQNTKLYDDNFHVVCRNKHTYNYQKISKMGNVKTILIPYEFLADTSLVGKYISKFIANGFLVYFKVRPDEEIDDQLNSYGAKSFDPSKFKVVKQITPELMAGIDIVAGTQTTLLYDLLPFNKSTWILKTQFLLLQDMVEDGLAIEFSMNDFDRIEEIYMFELSKVRNISQEKFSGSIPISIALRDLLDHRK